MLGTEQSGWIDLLVPQERPAQVRHDGSKLAVQISLKALTHKSHKQSAMSKNVLILVLHKDCEQTKHGNQECKLAAMATFRVLSCDCGKCHICNAVAH